MLQNISSFLKNKPALAIGFLFSVSSLLMGIWVGSIPGIKYRLGLSDSGLGLCLLFSPLGAITGMLISTRIFSKISVGRWMSIGYIAMSCLMILQVNAVNLVMFCICLYFFGVVSFLNGVSSNATVNLMEKRDGKLLMSTCHAMYSLGGAISAGVAALLFALYVPSGWQIVIMVTFIILIVSFNMKYYLANTDIIHSKSNVQFPSLTILGISFMCMVSFMAEGCVADWSAIYFKEVLHSPKAFISLGYAGFSLAMTLGRLNGDALFAKFGSKKLVIAGSIITSLGFLIVVLTPGIIIAIAGYVLIGIGCFSIVPILFRASANIPGLSAVEGFAMVTTGGLIGFLAGPSVIGFISEKAGLPKALSLLIVMTLLAAFVAWRNKFLSDKKMTEPALPYDEQIY